MSFQENVKNAFLILKKNVKYVFSNNGFNEKNNEKSILTNVYDSFM